MGMASKWTTVLVALLAASSVSAHASVLSTPPRPNPNDTVIFARWLVGQATWGVVSTLSVRLHGAPWGNVQSFADGMPGNGTGTPYFYLSKLDATPNDILEDSRASFTISEETVGTCTDDPEMPDCAKISLSGKLLHLAENETEASFAKAAIIAKHPDFQYLPPDHDFQVYKLSLTDIWMVNYFGGAKIISRADYYKC